MKASAHPTVSDIDRQTHAHLLPTAEMLLHVVHCNERVAQSATGRDSLFRINIQRPLQEMHKLQPVYIFSVLHCFRHPELETGLVQINSQYARDR